MRAANLFADIPPPTAEEHFETLFTRPGLRIERILSHFHASPPGFWYEQPDDEWVLLAQGHAQGQGKKSSKNANEQAQYCNRAGCQYQGRAICAQPFCAEMNYLWSIDRAQRRT